MKKNRAQTMAIFFLAVCMVRCADAAPYFGHPDFGQGKGLSGALFSGMAKTNAGMGSISLLPVFFHNAPPATAITQMFTQMSWSPLTIGGAASGGSGSMPGKVQGDIGMVADFGPQLEGLIVDGTRLFSASAGATVLNFFNPQAGAYMNLSAGVLGNFNLIEDGHFVKTSHDLFLSPVAFFVGPTIYFGGAK